MTDPLDAAVRALADGQLVVYPTDTLWGLGVKATDSRAVERLFGVKRRPRTQPVSIMLSSVEEVEPWVGLQPHHRAFLRRTLPGPVTAVLPASRFASRRLSPLLLNPARGLAVRVPDHPMARELARRVGPVTCTSANRHAEPPAGGLDGVRSVFGSDVAGYLRRRPDPSGRPSKIVDLTGPTPALVRS